MCAYRNFRDYHIEQLREPEDAKVYLSVALDDCEKNGDIGAFLLAVRDVAEAQGGMSGLAERVSLTREGLYKALSKNGNPQLITMGGILHGLGFRLSTASHRLDSTFARFHEYRNGHGGLKLPVYVHGQLIEENELERPGL